MQAVIGVIAVELHHCLKWRLLLAVERHMECYALPRFNNQWERLGHGKAISIEHHAVDAQRSTTVVIDIHLAIGDLSHWSGAKVKLVLSVQLRALNVDIALILVAQHVHVLTFIDGSKHGFACAQVAAIAAIEFHVERGNHAIVAAEGAVTKRIGNGTELAIVVSHHQLVVAFSVAQGERAVNILQLFG